MSQSVITRAFVEWKAQQAIDGKPVLLDEFVFAFVPDLDVTKPIPDTDDLPEAGQIVHRQAVSKAGLVNTNAVVYSVTMGADTGDFDFNWIGLLNKATGTVAAIVHAPTQRKIKNSSGQQGNVLTRSILMEFNNARHETEISVPAETWQIDFTARLAGVDERQRIENIDIFGAASFFGDGFLVKLTGNKYSIAPGAGYVAGLRSRLDAAKELAIPAKPTKVWADVVWTGSLVSVWGVETLITVKDELTDYVVDGRQHYVFAVASIAADGKVTDLRPKGTLDNQAASDAIKKHEQSRNHPDATTEAKGFTQLSSATDSESEELAATVKAIKAVNDNANGRVPSDRKVNNKALTADVTITAQDIFSGQAVPLGDAVDLNTILTAGLYFQAANAQAASGKNYPEAVAGSLEVLKHAGITQIYRVYNNSRHYIRSFYGNAWTGWSKQYDTANKPTAADVGALASGGTAVAATKLATARNISGVPFDGTGNITITAANVGALTQVLGDARYQLKTATVIGMRVGARGTMGSDSVVDLDAPVGNFITGRTGSNGDVRYQRWYIRPIQINVNGTWKTITA